jgi:tetratricopeptide (TPR) repeat protein
MTPSILLALLVLSAPGQRGGTGQTQGQTTGGTNSNTGSNRPATTTQPATNQPNNTANTNPANAIPIFISGNVLLSDGTPPPITVQVHVVCGNRSIKTEYVDSHGNFNLIINGAQGAQDAQDPEFSRSDFSRSDFNRNNLFGCEVKASLPGYLSNSIPLDRHSPLDNPDVGTVYLRRMIGEAGEGEGYTVSLTTKLAPKDARKEYEKGLASAKAKKWPDAEQEFFKAVTIYPKYALAWYELGRVYDQEKKADDALHAQQQAIEAEPKFVSPFAELTTLAYRQQKWADMVKYSSEFIKLSSFASPEIYLYNAVANYNLHQLDPAEKSARVAARLDDKHRIPRINYLLGLILAQKQDLKGAVENMKLYLQLSPAATDAASVQQQVAELEKAAGQQ